MVPPPLTIPPAFHEQWFNDASCAALARLAESVHGVPGLVVEVGSWEGRSTCALANAVYPRTVDAVDTWEGSPGEISQRLASLRPVFDQWSANVRHYTRGNVVPYVMDWREYVRDALTDNARIAFAFIDATHTYRAVRDNVEAFAPFMVEGGVMCGDDVHHPPIRRALDDVFGAGAWQRDASLWWVRWR